MRKGTDKERDRELIMRLQDEAPEVLKARIDFDSLITEVVEHPQSIPDKPARIRPRSNRRR